jgi:pimeloyl-ACP methyl ester carboxylesterase
MSSRPSPPELGPAIDGERRRWCPTGRASDGAVSFYVAARRRGRPLLLLHDLGLGSSSYEMRPLFESLRWRRPTYAVDLPGFGLSDRADVSYDPSLFARVLADLLEKVRRADLAADVVALGSGSDVAARVARDAPSLVRSIVMLEPAGLLSSGGLALDALSARVARRIGGAAVRGLFGLLSSRLVMRRRVAERFYGRPDPGLVAYAHRTTREPGAYRAPMAVLGSRPCAAETALLYRSLTVPVLVVHDARGSTAVELEAFLRGRANRFAVRISPTRGMPHFERRTETVAALDRFWRSLQRAAWDRAMR